MRPRHIALILCAGFMFGCGSYSSDSVLKKYLTARSASEQTKWMTSESQRRFTQESLEENYGNYDPSMEILEMRRIPTDNPKYSRLRVKTKDSKGLMYLFYTLKRDNFYRYRVCCSYVLDKEAYAHSKSNRLEQSRLALTEALQLDPYDAYAWTLLGEINMQLDRKEEAWLDLQKAMESDPTDPQPFLTAYEYWKDADKDKSIGYARQAASVAQYSFDTRPSSSYCANNLIRATVSCNAQDSLLHRSNILKNNLCNYDSIVAPLACAFVLQTLYNGTQQTEKSDLQENLSIWLAISEERYGYDTSVQKVVAAIKAASINKVRMKKYLESPKGRLEAEIYKAFGDYANTLAYALANVEDGVKLVSMKKPSDENEHDINLSLIKDYDDLDWLDQFQKIRSLANRLATESDSETWYVKKRLWAQWLYISDSAASKLASNF